MPPELLTDGTLSKATDAYSFGAILWELFSIDRPWCNMLPMQVNNRPAAPEPNAIASSALL